MLGMNRSGKTKNCQQLVGLSLLLIVGTIFTSYLQRLPIYDLQSAKFPPTIKYGIVSMLSIVIAKYFDGKYECNYNFIEHIGRNAIFYYFAQGIGSSINYYMVRMISLDNWFLKWVLTYIINVTITILIAEVLALMYSRLEVWIIHKRIRT